MSTRDILGSKVSSTPQYSLGKVGSVTDFKTEQPSLRPMIRKPVHKQVQDAIRTHIIENGLNAGDQLPPEGQLAKILGVSRNSVREGVKALEVQGVVEARVGAGLFVLPFSFDPILETLPYGLLSDLESVGHLLHLREVLDRGIVEQVIAAVDDKQLAALDSILDEWRLAASKGMYHVNLDREFHQALYSSLDNPLLSRLAGLFWDTMQGVADQSTFPHVENPIETHDLHRDMVEALRARNPIDLRKAINRHYPGIWSSIL